MHKSSDPGQLARQAQVFTAACLIGLCATLIAIDFTTVGQIKAAYLATRPALSVRWLIAQLHAFDIILAVLAACCGLGILFAEFRAHGLRRLIRGDLPRLQAVSLAALLVYYSHAILLPGLLDTGDAGSHVARVSHIVMAILGGDSLYWDNSFFAGGLLAQNTGPIFHWLASLTALATGDATSAIKLVCFAARFFAGLFMWLFLRRAGLGRTAAFFGTIFYVGSFYMSYMVAIRGKFPQELHFTAFAAVLYCLQSVMRAPRIASPAWIGLCLSAIILIGNHQPTALMAAFLLGIYVAAALLPKRDLRPLPGFIAASAVILAGAGCFLAPFALERGWTGDAVSTGGLLSAELPTLGALRNLVVWDAGGSGPISTGYIGTVLLGLIGVGLWLQRDRLVRQSAAAALARISLFLAIISIFLAGPQVRPTVFVFSFVCIAAAASTELMLRAWPKAAWLPVAVFTLFSLDAVAAPLLSYARTDLRGLVTGGENWARQAGSSRVLEVTRRPGAELDVSYGPGSTPLHYARLQMLYGPHKLDSTKAHNAMVATLYLARQDVRLHGALSDDTKLLLQQYNVAWVTGIDGTHIGLPAGLHDAIPDKVLGPYWHLPDATPILSSSTLTPQARPASFDATAFWDISFTTAPFKTAALDAAKQDVTLIHRMGIDLRQRRATMFLLPQIPADDFWKLPPGPPAAVKLASDTVESGRVLMRVEANRPTYLRLAHPWFPGLIVTINGKPTPALQDVFSMIVVKLEAGTSDIIVAVYPSPLRRLSLGLSAAIFLALIAALLVQSIRRRGPAPA